jgi:hypothetical protein
MIQLVNNILQDTLKTDVDYIELATDLINLIRTKEKSLHLIDTIQILIMREAYRFMTFIECEEIFNKIEKVVKNNG